MLLFRQAQIVSSSFYRPHSCRYLVAELPIIDRKEGSSFSAKSEGDMTSSRRQMDEPPIITASSNEQIKGGASKRQFARASILVEKVGYCPG